MKKFFSIIFILIFLFSPVNISSSAEKKTNTFEVPAKSFVTVEQGIAIVLHELGFDKNLQSNPQPIYDSAGQKPSKNFLGYVAFAKKYLPKSIPPFNSKMTRVFAAKFILSLLNCNTFDSQNPLDNKIVLSILVESKVISSTQKNELEKPITGGELQKLVGRVKIKMIGVDMAKPAWEAYSKGKLKDAEFIFKRCINAGLHLGTTPSYLANSYYGLGLVYAHHSNKRYYEAYSMLIQAIKIDNNGKIAQAAKKYLAEKLPPYQLDLNYQPTKNLTYEEVMALVGHHLYLDVKEVPSNFAAKDKNNNNPSSWAAPYVRLAFYRKSVPFVPSSFKDIAPRYWIAAYLCNVKGLMHYDYDKYYDFKDIKSLDTNYKMFISVVVDKGIMEPTSKETFSPYDGINRIQLRKILLAMNSIKAISTPKPPSQQILTVKTSKIIATYYKGVEAEQIQIMTKRSKFLDMINFDAVMLGVASTKEHTQAVSTYFYNPDLEAALQKANELGISTFLSLSNLNKGKFDAQLVHNYIKDEKGRKTLVNDLVKLVNLYNLTGVHIDFEHLNPQDKANLTEFIKLLSEKLKRSNKKLTMVIGAYMSDLEANASVYDFEKLAKYVDYFNLILYDDFPKSKYPITGIDGPISNIVRIERVLKYMTLRIPSSKILMGIGVYGIDFNITNKTAENVKLSDIPNIVKNAIQGSVKYFYDSKSQSPYIEFKNPDNTVHKVWYENKKSLEERMKMVHKYNLAGICFYWLGSSSNELYQVFDKYLK
ncbi:glycosyl hydrolase family 18 protein [Anaerocellum danielii]|uniref:Glycosyl hydrolase family 18 protein n=1 Tax=Anaerocellum danielii TaxID=1387557 RepID=A0ABZ0U0T1_9FIRM|nr:glycosyl hydrolase family 18 protein [Caldicellulosiruptor danielii]WPX08702.1 glycosyl hydrolase family 18 protein [Caldicellulosiruptor danielii]